MMDLAEPHMFCWLPGATVTGTVIDQWLILPDAHIYTTATRDTIADVIYICIRLWDKQPQQWN